MPHYDPATKNYFTYKKTITTLNLLMIYFSDKRGTPIYQKNHYYRLYW